MALLSMFLAIALFAGFNAILAGAPAEWYWRVIGVRLSHLSTWLVDPIPFAVSEILLQYSICGTVVWIFPWPKKYSRLCRAFTMPGLFFLPLMILSQGATPIDCTPGNMRQRPSQRIQTGKEPSTEQIVQYVHEQESLFNKNFSQQLYSNLEKSDYLEEVNHSLDRACQLLGYPTGRHVKKIKDMWGLTRLMGLAYGGPAYHEVLTGEVALASQHDFPITKDLYWQTIAHECAHARGFTREMDAEILTWLALKLSHAKELQLLASLMVLDKSGRRYKIPEFFRDKRIEAQHARAKALQSLPVVRFLKSISQKTGIQNSGKKYGVVEVGEIVSAENEFFKSVYHLQNTLLL